MSPSAAFTSAVALLMVGCANAPAPSPAGPSLPTLVASAEPADVDKRVCRRETPAGSNVPVRVCRTRAEIAKAEEDARKVTGRIGDGASTPNRPGS